MINYLKRRLPLQFVVALSMGVLMNFAYGETLRLAHTAAI